MAAYVVRGDELGQDAQTEKLHADDQEGDGIKEHWPVADRPETQDPEDGQVE